MSNVRIFWEIGEQHEIVVDPRKLLADLGRSDAEPTVESVREAWLYGGDLEVWLSEREGAGTYIETHDRLVTRIEETTQPVTEVRTPTSPVQDLYNRIKAVQDPDGNLPGAEVVSVLTAWFAEHGIEV